MIAIGRLDHLLPDNEASPGLESAFLIVKMQNGYLLCRKVPYSSPLC